MNKRSDVGRNKTSVYLIICRAITCPAVLRHTGLSQVVNESELEVGVSWTRAAGASIQFLSEQPTAPLTNFSRSNKSQDPSCLLHVAHNACSKGEGRNQTMAMLLSTTQLRSLVLLLVYWSKVMRYMFDDWLWGTISYFILSERTLNGGTEFLVSNHLI
jgi:hypothetical protein